MAQSNTPFTRQPYEPLPLTTDDNIGHALYNAPHDVGDPVPPSPSHNTPQFQHADLPDDDFIPSGAARPRFLGPALYSEVGPETRHSFASSHNSLPSVDRGSHYTASSVYALNDAQPPPLSQFGTYRDDPYATDSFEHGDVPMSPMGRGKYRDEKRAIYASPRSKRRTLLWVIVVGVILLIIAAVVGIYFAVIKPKSHNSSTPDQGKDSGSGDSAPDKSKTLVVTGGDGSTVTMEDGTTFTYSNPFGGYWYYDENDPFNNGARAQSWAPALNETFKYGIDKIWGVNIGGWLVLEPFICPAPFQKYYPNAVDEWTLHTLMAADTANGGLSQLEDHYKTFITEKDFAEIAGAGLNYVRIPLPYWAIEVRDGEPFLPKVAWTYFLKAIKWARKYGLRINLDLHTAPGSQNGWNHSGRLGTINVLLGPMGYANAQRLADYVRIIAEFISQPQYRDVVTMFGVLNEPGNAIGQDVLESYYSELYQIIRTAGGTGQGNGPFISYHDGFFTRAQWAGYLPGADRIALDTHPYMCFDAQSNNPMSTYATRPCDSWGKLVNDSMSGFGLTVAGEWSNAVTDCALFLTGVNAGTRYQGNWTGGGNFPTIGDCTPWNNYQSWDNGTKADYQTFALATMDALQNWFFWTWKIGNSSWSGTVESPQWSYQLGLEQGWMPKDPRQAIGQCGNSNPWTPPLQPAQTGGAGAGNIASTVLAAIAWPPASLTSAGAVTNLPQYTPTGAIPTLSPPTLSPTPTAPVDVGSGWNNVNDNAGLAVNIPSCTYLDPWIGPTAAPPSPLCSS